MKTLIFFLLFALSAKGTPIRTQAEFDRIDPRAKKHARENYRTVSREIKRDGLIALARRSDAAMDYLVAQAGKELRLNRRWEEADLMEADWNFHWRGILENSFHAGRDLDSRPGLILFIDRLWDKMVSTIGIDATKALIGDLYAVNKELIPVFSPCSFSMVGVTISREAEYRIHFSRGSHLGLWGLAPISVKYSVIIPCSIGTSGLLVSFLCTPAGLGAEFLFGSTVSDPLSDSIFERMCM